VGISDCSIILALFSIKCAARRVAFCWNTSNWLYHCCETRINTLKNPKEDHL
jgi:hypothetical protein